MTAVPVTVPSRPTRRELVVPHRSSPEPRGTGRAPDGRPVHGRFRDVQLHVVDGCEGCRCAGSGPGRGRPVRWSRICATLETWQRLGGTNLTLLGGEPTTHPDFASVVRFARAVGYQRVTTTTGGLGPAARTLAGLTPSELSRVQVDLDGGSPRSHDPVRGTGTFATAVATAGDLTRRGFDVRFVCTVSRGNRDDCLRLLDVADAHGVPLVEFQARTATGRGGDRPAAELGPREWIEFYDTLPAAAASHATQVTFRPTWARTGRAAVFAEAGFTGCAGRDLDRVTVFPDGRCYVCPCLSGTGLNFATTTADGTVTVNREGNEFDLFTAGLVAPACGNCPVASACGGGCPAEEVVEGAPACAADPEVVAVCRLWTTAVTPALRTPHR